MLKHRMLFTEPSNTGFKQRLFCVSPFDREQVGPCQCLQNAKAIMEPSVDSAEDTLKGFRKIARNAPIWLRVPRAIVQ